MTSRQSNLAVTVGLHIVDILGRHVDKIPEGQGVTLIEEIRMTVAGTAAATAVDLAKLGVSVATFGVIGDDELGSWIRAKMQAVGVDTDGLIAVDSHPTSATLLPIRTNGERPALHVPGANALLSATHIPQSILEAARVLHVGGTCLLPLLDGEPTARLLQAARVAGTLTTLDLIGLPDVDHEAIFGPCYPHIDYFLPNDEDALMLSGAKTVEAAASWFANRGVGTSLISLGEDGVLVTCGSNTGTGGGSNTGTGGGSNPGTGTRIPAYDVNVVDTTGCGDAFSAGFIAGLIDGLDACGAAEIGVATGSMVATGLGSDAGITDRASVDQFIATTARRTSR